VFCLLIVIIYSEGEKPLYPETDFDCHLTLFLPYLFSRSSLHLFFKTIIVTVTCWKLALHLFVCDTLILQKPHEYELLTAKVLASILYVCFCALKL